MDFNFSIEDLEFIDFQKILRKGDKIEIYTDGSCIGNPGPGGWACVFASEIKDLIYQDLKKIQQTIVWN